MNRKTVDLPHRHRKGIWDGARGFGWGGVEWAARVDARTGLRSKSLDEGDKEKRRRENRSDEKDNEIR